MRPDHDQGHDGNQNQDDGDQDYGPKALMVAKMKVVTKAMKVTRTKMIVTKTKVATNAMMVTETNNLGALKEGLQQ